MKREARDFRETAPKPVKRIALDDSKPRRRLLAIILALAVAAGAFFFAFRGLTNVEPGWATLEADGGVGMNVSGDFRLQAELGAGKETPAAERRKLTAVYSKAAREAYTLYTTQENTADVTGLWYINHHPGEEIQVDGRLYRSMQKSLASGNWLYLGPVYETWDSVWFSREDREAEAADPRKNGEQADFLAQVMKYIRAGDIRLELREGRKVCLYLSDAYRAFGQENGITRWIDFGWQKNAFIIDDLAEALETAGWSRAVISSTDGFIRCLDDRGTFTLNVLADAGEVKQAAQMEYRGPASLLMLLPSPGGSRPYGYRYRDGTGRTAWISPENGLDVKPADGMTAYAEEGGCADLLCRFLPLLTRPDATDREWSAAAGDDTALWLAREGKLISLGNKKMTLVSAE